MGKYWMIVIDGTGLVCYDKPHCECCLTKTIHGKRIWYHNVLEAKLITPDGLALSVCTEFIENEPREASKQDCELKAFYRMAKKLKKDFPQLPILIGGDSLFARVPVFEIARKNNWRFIITFKRGSIPTLFDEFEKLKKRCPENTARREDESVVGNFSWVNHFEHAGHRLAVLECKEIKKKTGEMTRFVWITNIKVNDQNYKSIAKEGRSRWTIENQGFNAQKNGGYALEHPFCSNPNGAKNFYLLLQIAHIINQLLERGSLLRHLMHSTFGSIRNLSCFLLEAFRTCSIYADVLKAELSKPYQLRLFDT
ncbi:MAG: hypothetical protein PHO53_06220 [Actinomycetota bacterium]|nr:hypothetical protein [Actinomycetota bacterium]